MAAYLFDWLSLLGRWLHLITGIAWIGSSFYFVWLDNHLQPPAEELARKGVGGELWSVHGGGFYNAHKYKSAPAVLPQTLHWFYWEAYSTFLSGLFLLCLLYFGKAEVYLIDPQVAALSQPQAIGIGIAFLIGGWLVYDALCRTALARNGLALGAVITVLLTIAAWGMCHLFSGRGAYIIFGAMLGSIMVANVFFVIIPGQREMVRAKREGREPDPLPGLKGKLRSTHNTYFTLPVLFTMISNHYAMTFGARYNWIVLVALCVAGVCIRTFFVMRHKVSEYSGSALALPAIAGVLLLIGVGIMLAPARSSGGVATTAAASTNSAMGDFARVQQIVAQRCIGCHAEKPTQPGFPAAPNGVLLDSADRILVHVMQMEQQVAARTMPIGNLTNMTEEERAELLAWIHRGAPH